MQTTFRRFAVAGVSIFLAAAAAQAQPTSYVYLGQDGQTSSSIHDPNSWSPNLVPGVADRATFNGGGGFNKIAELGSTDIHWYQMFLNNVGPAQVNGTGTIYLDIPMDADGNGDPLGGPEQWGFWTAGGEGFGGPVVASVVNPNIVTSSYIETNGSHSVVFNGNVTALTLQAYAGTTQTYNGNVTLTAGEVPDTRFLTGNDTNPMITFNKNVHIAPWDSDFGFFATGFHLRNNMTVNLGPNSSLTSNNPLHPNGWGEVNMFNGSKIRLFGNNKIGRETNLWSRDNPTLTNTLDLNGFSDGVTFLGTHPTATFILDYGTTGVSNAFEWDTSQFMEGQYTVANFQIGVDHLTLGAPGNGFWFETGDVPTEEALLAKIKINGFSYAPFNPSATTPYWTVLNPSVSREIAFQNIATPNADFDHNNIVDGKDILIWQDNLGLTGQTDNSKGDADRLGTVNAADLDIIKAQFGTNPNSLPTTGAIPEPASIGMLAVGLAGLARRRRVG